MSFDWSHYLSVAQELAEEAKDAPLPIQEAKLRASISRAYYAVFGKARYHLRRNDKIPEPNPLVDLNGKRVNIHQYVRETFLSRSDQKDCLEIGLALERMSQNRNIADYDLNHVMLKNRCHPESCVGMWRREKRQALNTGAFL